MIQKPDIDPIIFSIQFGDAFALDFRWYSLAYLAGILFGWLFGRYRAKRAGGPLSLNAVDDYAFFFIPIGIIFGGRIGYVVLYQWSRFIDDPMMLFRVFEGGMSFHGGMIGVLLISFLFAHLKRISYLSFMDFVVPSVPFGLFFGRLANFINGELQGRLSDMPWAVLFEPGGQPRHPSQLYEAGLEGIVLFFILWKLSVLKRVPVGVVTGMFGVCYGLFRFFVEFFRTPDAHIGFDAFGWMTRGQVLSIPMIIIGALIIRWAYRNTKQSILSSLKG